MPYPLRVAVGEMAPLACMGAFNFEGSKIESHGRHAAFIFQLFWRHQVARWLAGTGARVLAGAHRGGFSMRRWALRKEQAEARLLASEGDVARHVRMPKDFWVELSKVRIMRKQ